ncbi:rod shape-determining protein MreD [Staphylococcus warneri]|uniref:Rod shape-determining protein MreD n=3 Tax=Staphylococcus warneri TaxID=1292 RepID=A0A364UQ78_STAWA|nr:MULTISPECIES: rod shape-determining protein MreD [Staphylococcus]MBJ7885525.1 rod shape-determining protein MreD [Bacillaceae bacterium HSR45]PAK74191.1 rod shape-determining protein MreD [Staphylococcus pasteuri]POO69014.1 rod shape-determining protein MreD [Bacillus amyloliquefaciens]SKR87714.1 rod shape-determining protein MreD [Mycobacteroides abscessus subsp. abscessus]AGC90418.1 rod shape-determining protein MreD [Staphylococcus warneri SG1]
MRGIYYFLIGILLFYIDTIIGLVIPMHFGKIDVIFVPHLTLMYLLILTIYRSFGVALILAIFFGLITDLYFGSIYGLYMFGYILAVVVMDRFFKIFYKDKVMIFIIILVSTLLIEIYVALIYGLIGFIQFNLLEFLLLRLLPTFILNIILLTILYPIMLKFLRKIQIKIDSRI